MDYKPFLAEADSYFKVVNNSLTKTKKLGNKVLFSISTMIIEKYLVAVLLANGKVVSGHTVRSLVAMASGEFNNLPKEVAELASVDNKLDLCSFDPVSSVEPNDEEMNSLHAKLIVLKNFVHNFISTVNSSIVNS